MGASGRAGPMRAGVGLCRELGDHEGCAMLCCKRSVDIQHACRSAQCDCYAVQYVFTFEDVVLAAISAIPAGKAQDNLQMHSFQRQHSCPHLQVQSERVSDL